MTAPVRMCIGCRNRTDKSDLLRLVWRGSEVAVDLHQVEPGRGAYLHPTTACLDLAARRRAVGRALRISGANATLVSVQQALERRADPDASQPDGPPVRGRN